MKPKILYIITRLILGGAQKDTISSVALLRGNGYDAALLSGPSGGPEGDLKDFARINGVDVVEIPELKREIDPLKDIIALFKIYRFIKNNRFDIVHTHTSKAGFLGRLAARLAGVRIIVHTPHGHVFYGYYGRFKTKMFIMLEKAASLCTSALIAISEAEKKDYIRYGIISEKKMRVIHSGIDLAEFSGPARPAGDMKKQLNMEPDVPVIGTVGRLVREKGHIYFLRAAKRVLLEFPRAQFLVVGGGILRPEIEDAVKEMGIGGNVKLLGIRLDISDILYIMDIFAMPSLNEGMGRAAAEAMMRRKAVVAFRVCGLEDLINSGVNGILVEPADHVKLAEAITGLLKDKNRREKMGEAAANSISDDFDSKKVIGQVGALYQELIAGKNKR